MSEDTTCLLIMAEESEGGQGMVHLWKKEQPHFMGEGQECYPLLLLLPTLPQSNTEDIFIGCLTLDHIIWRKSLNIAHISLFCVQQYLYIAFFSSKKTGVHTVNDKLIAWAQDLSILYHGSRFLSGRHWAGWRLIQASSLLPCFLHPLPSPSDRSARSVCQSFIKLYLTIWNCEGIGEPAVKSSMSLLMKF